MSTTRTALPGIGTLHMLQLHDGRRIGVIGHRDGRRELVVYDAADPDAGRIGAVLTPEEASTLTEVLQAAGPPVHCARLEHVAAGLAVVQLLVGDGSPWLHRPVATGEGVLAAVVRDDRVVPAEASPRCRVGDVVVLVGHHDAVLDALDALLWERPADGQPSRDDM
ncbi:potassium transporter TrkA [Dactylosporangium salmoneum]|uniref:Potassium/proton antiporter subunit KhtT-like N-terminal domain-containing protein n=1 Tax=Dactylosporangium salmoneum TaxID=53361 RepID=A0ABN3FPF3_9ACTN